MTTARWTILLLAASAFAATWTDRSEYDLALTIRTEAVPKKRLELLDQWRAKYPKTDLRQARRELYLSTYQSLADTAGMLAVAKEMVADQPNNLVGLYWCTLLIPAGKDVSPAALTLGETSARRLLASADRAAKQKPEVELLAHRTLGWVQWQRGDLAAAQTELNTCLQLDPKNAEISSWYGTILGLQKQPDKQPQALWHLARAASLKGDEALPEIRQRQVNALLERLYTSFHGSLDGLDQIRAAAAENPQPPANFNVETAAAIAFRKQLEDLDRTNPQLAAWLRIRSQLEGPDGVKYFTDTLRANPIPKLKGTLLRWSPPKRPAELVVAVRDAASEEITIKLNTPFPHDADPGTPLEFEGTVESFTASPFMLTIVADRDNVQGWPATRPRQ